MFASRIYNQYISSVSAASDMPFYPFTVSQIFGSKHVMTLTSRMNAIANRHWSELFRTERLDMLKKFNKWQVTTDKQTVAYCYGYFGWRALYVRRLYGDRIRTTLHAFNEIWKENSYLLDLFRSLTLFISIGCGPGPEIVAILAILYDLGVEHEIEALGVDRYGEWSEYINSLNTDAQHKVVFGKLLVDEESMSQLPNGQLCIMSYTDASMHTQGFWRQLKDKFQLIVILDQRNPNMTSLLREEGYHMIEYAYKGVQPTKRIFYWLSGRLSSGMSSISRDFSGPITSSLRSLSCSRNALPYYNSYNRSVQMRCLSPDVMNLRNRSSCRRRGPKRNHNQRRLNRNQHMGTRASTSRR